MFDNEQPTSVQQKANDDPAYDDGQPPAKTAGKRKRKRNKSQRKKKLAMTPFAAKLLSSYFFTDGVLTLLPLQVNILLSTSF